MSEKSIEDIRRRLKDVCAGDFPGEPKVVAVGASNDFTEEDKICGEAIRHLLEKTWKGKGERVKPPWELLPVLP